MYWISITLPFQDTQISGCWGWGEDSVGMGRLPESASLTESLSLRFSERSFLKKNNAKSKQRRHLMLTSGLQTVHTTATHACAPNTQQSILKMMLFSYVKEWSLTAVTSESHSDCAEGWGQRRGGLLLLEQLGKLWSEEHTWEGVLLYFLKSPFNWSPAQPAGCGGASHL